MPEINHLDNSSDLEKVVPIAKWQREVSGSIGARGRRRRKTAPILYLTEIEINALFRAIETEGKRKHSRTDATRDRALFEVALGRGLRASEVGLLELQLKKAGVAEAKLQGKQLRPTFKGVPARRGGADARQGIFLAGYGLGTQAAAFYDASGCAKSLLAIGSYLRCKQETRNRGKR